jgi:small subunit ribosomal protein S21
MATKQQTSSYHKNYYPAEHSGICVVRRKNESDEDLLKRFRKKYSKSGIARELKDRMAYQKPSEKKRRKRMQAQRLREKEEEKLQLMRERYLKKKRKLQRKEDKNDRSSGRQSVSKTTEERADTRRDRPTG